VVRETTSEQSKFEVVIVTNDAKIFTIKDDSNWRQFKLITDWIDSKIIKNDIIEHYIDPETGVEI